MSARIVLAVALVLGAGVMGPGVMGAGMARARAAETPADAEHSGADLAAVETDSKAVLRICRDGFMFTDCRVYGHVMIPRQVMLGDVFPITFGSNPKRIQFKAEHIQRQGAGCDILGKTGDGEADRLTSNRCRVLDVGAARQP